MTSPCTRFFVLKTHYVNQQEFACLVYTRSLVVLFMSWKELLHDK